MSTGRKPADYLEDICKAMEKALEFQGNMPLAAFSQDDKTPFAVIRALEILGEAAKRIPEAMRSRYSDVPWRSMGGSGTNTFMTTSA